MWVSRIRAGCCAIRRRAMQLYEITPSGNRGNYFSGVNRHWYRQQAIGQPVSADRAFARRASFEIRRRTWSARASTRQVQRHDYEVLRDDNRWRGCVTFVGMPFQERKNLEARAVRAGSLDAAGRARRIEGGLRTEWNEVVRDLEDGAARGGGVGAGALAGHQDFRGMGRLLRRDQPGNAWRADRGR